MNVDIKTYGPKNSKVAFCYTTKDRPEYTKQTLPLILNEEGDFDLYWLDGSTTGAGMAAYMDFINEPSRLKEVHLGVTGGPAIAIQYAWQLLYNKGYDYVGLIENDVLLDKGWFNRCFDLFKITQRAGAVSARCFKDRILIPGGGYAVMSNIGAGMILIKRELIIPLLENWHRPMLREMQAMFKAFTGIEYPIPHQVIEVDPEIKQEWVMTHDWWWEAVMLMHGYQALACTPSMARNIDPIGALDWVQNVATV